MRIFQVFGGWFAAWAAAATLTLTAGGVRAQAPTVAEGAGAKAYIIVDAKSGRVLAGNNAADKLQVASLTKIATAVVVLDWARLGGHTLDENVAIPTGTVGVGTPGGLEAGDEVSIRDLLYAALLQSDNVAADALAEWVGRDLLRTAPAGGSASQRGGPSPASVRFIAEMNALARSLHMDHTRFLNPTGVDGTERPFSTAADLARLTRVAMDNAGFRFIVSQKDRRITLHRAGAPNDFLVHNTNQLLGTHRIDGVKTGSTTRAGECLVLSAARDPIVQMDGNVSHITPRRLIVVLLGSPDRFGEGKALIERGESLYDSWAATGYPSDPKLTL